MKAPDQVRGSSLSKSGHYKNQELKTDKEGGKSAEEGANKRRTRSYSPPATTKSCQQHTQEIRNSQASRELSTEGVTLKWQGIGSPLRNKSRQDSESMSTDSSLSVKELVLDLLSPVCRRRVADVSPTSRRHRQMSPNLGRHCVSLRHRRGPDIPNFPQLQPTSTSQPKRTSTLAIIEFLCLNSNNNQEITDMLGIPRHVVKCRVV